MRKSFKTGEMVAMKREVKHSFRERSFWCAVLSSIAGIPLPVAAYDAALKVRTIRKLRFLRNLP